MPWLLNCNLADILWRSVPFQCCPVAFCRTHPALWRAGKKSILFSLYLFKFLFDLFCSLIFLLLVWLGVWPFKRGHRQELQRWAAAAGVKVPAGPPAWALQCGSDDTGHSQKQVRASAICGGKDPLLYHLTSITNTIFVVNPLQMSSTPPPVQHVWLGSCDPGAGAAGLLPYGCIWTQTWTIWQDHRRVCYHSPDPHSAGM